MNLADVVRDFHGEESCIRFLERQRWPNGVMCTKCKSTHISRAESKGKTGKPRFLYDCIDCHNQFSVKCGTLFHNSHIPLMKWFQAIAIICQSKKGISANQVGRTIGVSTKSAWYLCHRIREAMNTGDLPLLAGTVEIDETYVGGKQRRGEPRMSWYERKIPVMGMKQRGGDLRFRKITRPAAKEVREVVNRCLSPDVERIMTDESTIYPFAFNDEQKKKHSTVCHSITYANGEIHTNEVEGSFSLFKRALVGSYHRLSFKHLDRYLAEFEWRANNRRNPQIFEKAIGNAAKAKHLTFRALVDGAE